MFKAECCRDSLCGTGALRNTEQHCFLQGAIKLQSLVSHVRNDRIVDYTRGKRSSVLHLLAHVHVYVDSSRLAGLSV